MSKKRGEFKADVVSDYFPEDDSIFLILVDKHLMVSLEDLTGRQLNEVIKHLKKPKGNKIDALGVTTTVTLSDELKKKLIAHLEELKEIRKKS